MGSMGLAIVDGVRCAPRPGLKGNCPACGRPAIAKCGDLNRWHWAHAGRRHCDPWYENEGPWHREWKQQFPLDMHEIVHFDQVSGEKHIADIKRPDGLVIELQNSTMEITEMESRESFYGEKMIWIVNADPFRSQIHFFDALPDPDADFVADLVFGQPHPQWVKNRVKPRRGDGRNLMFFRRSERLPDSSMQRVYSGDDVIDLIRHHYVGHHLCLWQKPREVWLHSTRLTFFDFGSEEMWVVRRYGPEKFFCLQRASKQALIASILNGATPVVAPPNI
ncbi:competence protein CoiA [Burkholderia gladioli]|uniref:competence protein CoiA n=1 Tax=Burkholderia gladioli TaxID=28095 RepID=UPI0016408F59|nr:competence protein CoiA family protein [Burkholderia gladioli]